MKKIFVSLALLAVAVSVFAQTTVVVMKTTLGDVRMKLYDDTPLHRDNFVKLVNDGFYDGVLFHRVIKDFMVQAGDPNSKNPENTIPLGAGSTGYTIPAEINYPAHFHKYGALAAARTNNPERRSSGSQFYIVTGQKYAKEDVEARALRSLRNAVVSRLVKENEEELRQLQATGGRAALEPKFREYIALSEKQVTEVPAELVETYSTLGGTPHLDGEYTVFGEVIEGMDVVEKIQNVETGDADRPVTDVKIISMSVEKQ